MAYSIVALTASLVAAWGAVRDADWSRHVTSGVLCVHAGAFIPGLAVDPVLAGFVVVWQLVELGVHLIDRRAADRRRRVRRTQTSADIDDWYRVWGPSTRHLLLTAVVLTVAVVGYGVTNRPTAIATCAAINVVAFAVSMRFLWMLFRAGNWPVLAVGVPWSVLVAAGPSVDGALIAAAVANALAFGFLLVRSPLFDDLLAYFFDFPALLIVASFASVILFGTLMLTLPAASPGPTSISPVDALFTSTSATCVTGLIVLDTPP